MSDRLKQGPSKGATTLLVLAAGLGSRYGGLKQVDPVGPTGEWILDYMLFDALAAGFSKVVFVIRPEIEDAFRAALGPVLEGRVETVYVHQTADRAVRQKPWGTGHAVLCAREAIAEPFAVINADDYYGAQALGLIHSHLQQLGAGQTHDFAMVGYALKNTLSIHGVVCRGLCTCRADCLVTVEECRELQQTPEGIVGVNGRGQPIRPDGDALVSLNLWGFGPTFLTHLAEGFRVFHTQHGHDPTKEFYLPAVVDWLVQQGQTCVRVLPVDACWFGVTYREDKTEAQQRIRAMIEQGLYPETLWGEHRSVR
ncbi:NDP-sugar synthase [Planctomycetota bacterium]